MIRSWFRTQVRKFLSGGSLRMTSRSARQLGVTLRLETLEDRALTSTLNVEPAGLLPPPPVADTPALIPPKIEVTPSNPNPALLGGTLLDIPAPQPPTPDPAGSSITPDSGTSPDFSSPATPPGSSATDSEPSSANVLPPSGTEEAAPSGLGTPRPEEPATPLGKFPESSSPSRTTPAVATPVQEGPIVLSDPASEPSQASPDSAAAARAVLSGTAATPGERETDARAAPAPAQLDPGGAGTDEIVPLGTTPNSRTRSGARPRRAPQGRLADRPATPSPSGFSTVPLRPTATADVRALPAEGPWYPDEVSDGSLLQRFVVDRDQAAFTTLVQRYARFVLGVCQRVLGDSHAAQDAFQATFLVLARKAGMLDRDGPLGGWLYKVAYHLSLRLRAVAARQRRQEKDAVNSRSTQAADESIQEMERQELAQVLSEELERLPEKYRVPLVLCYFDGRTHAEAAAVIGMPRGSIAKRIGEGLERLRERMLDRGLVL